MNKNYKVKVDNSYEFDLKNSDVEKLDLLKLTQSQFHVISNYKSFDIKLKESEFYNKKYVITVNENSYTVNISNELDQLITEMGFTIGTAKKANDIKAPMPGLILSINVKEGQQVNEGDPLLILEAMKMENTISAPKDGVIKLIAVKSGATVEKGKLIIEMA
jgi:biotin carboxyl carrier protein